MTVQSSPIVPHVRPPGTFADYLRGSQERPIYVVLGVQGSGTNLLSRILVRVFGFSVVLDRSVVFNAAVRLGDAPTRHDVVREIDRFRRFLAPSRFDRLMGRRFLNKPQPFDGIFNELDPSAIRSGSEFARLIYAYRAFALGAREMAIKSDDIWEHIDDIDAVLPNRRIILLTRDFRDNLVSVGGKHFGPVEPICAARYVKRRFETYHAEYRRSGKNGFHVRFETLVGAPRQFIDDFARHFGVVPASDPESVFQKVQFRPNKIAKWKQLGSRDLAWCEAILREELVTFGYEPVCPPTDVPGPARVARATVRDLIRRAPQKMRHILARFET